MTKKDYIPPDITRCQALKPNGNSFMTLGGVLGHTRCVNTPVFIAIEKAPGDDGHIGSMSLCASCRVVMERQMPGHAIFTLIEETP